MSRKQKSVSDENVLSAEEIRRHLKNKDVEIYIYDCIDSTNNEARRMCGTIKNISLFISEEQSAGKGRLGRSFYSPKKTGIYMSLAFKTNLEAFNNPMRITMKAAVAVARALERLENIEAGVKWVNDVYYNGRKISGILTEGVLDVKTGMPLYAIVGIGINTSAADFPEDIKNKAGSVNISHSRNEVIAEIINELLPLYEKMEDTSFMEEYRKRSIVTGERAKYEEDGDTVLATILGIADNGGLIVQRTDGKCEIITAGIVEMNL